MSVRNQVIDHRYSQHVQGVNFTAINNGGTCTRIQVVYDGWPTDDHTVHNCQLIYTPLSLRNTRRLSGITILCVKLYSILSFNIDTYTEVN